MVGPWIAFVLALLVYLGVVVGHGPVPVPPQAQVHKLTPCEWAKIDKAAGGALDPALFCK